MVEVECWDLEKDFWNPVVVVVVVVVVERGCYQQQ